MSESQSATIFRAVPGYQGYQVGNDGSVWTCWVKTSPNVGGRCVGARYVQGTEWRQLAFALNRTGYPRVYLTCDGVIRGLLVHILVLEAFVGPRPEGHEGCHNNGIKHDCRLENLRWDTPRGNWNDRRRHGTWNPTKGEIHGMAKLNDQSVLEMRRLDSEGVPSPELARRFGISHGQTRNIVLRRNWKHLP